MNDWKHSAYLGIGSNLGDRLKNISEAIRLLEEHPLVKVNRLSHFYETEPLTLRAEKQSWYLNCVLKLRTSLNAVRLFHLLQEIETLLGRTRSHRWAPRNIDLDLLFFDDEILRTKSLTIPHPQLHQRRFVLEPLAEVAPNFIHPIKGLSVKTLLEKLNDNKKVTPLYKFFLSQPSDGVLKTPFHERL
ncbi:MAG TPA: 2-amino-4-hydroxy-6-hydroxymethyldihydropteridine diphosphokinase [Deltaproteobacteria bacterium]|nr:2-amino-4-hydroxy-6-hydroxymethyldihydropteridine diphosphokinase [Deltaproteobacteria bacterium]